MKKHLFSFVALVLVLASAPGMPKVQVQDLAHRQADLTQPQPYVLKRVSSADPTGGNADFRPIEPGATLTVFDVDGPAVLTHIWLTLYDSEPYHLKRMVLRMYWDGEVTPSIETPLGVFFGLGLGDYHVWESDLLSVANERALNCFFPMPFQKRHASPSPTKGSKKFSLFTSALIIVRSRSLCPPIRCTFMRNFAKRSPILAGPTNGNRTEMPSSKTRKTWTAKGITWAAEQGYAQAQINLGDL